MLKYFLPAVYWLLFVFIGLFLLASVSGCTAFEKKADSYVEASKMVLNPYCIDLHYNRRGFGSDNASFSEMRCTGKHCDKIPACSSNEETAE